MMKGRRELGRKINYLKSYQDTSTRNKPVQRSYGSSKWPVSISKPTTDGITAKKIIRLVNKQSVYFERQLARV